MPASDTPVPEEMGGPVIHDHRRIDPVTGQVRRGKHAASKPAGAQGAGRSGAQGPGPDSQDDQDVASASGPQPAQPEPEPVAAVNDGDKQLQAQLAERTSDLQRLQAEYANYRKRVERDRAAVKEQAVAATLSGLLPVLDDIDRANEHGELSGGFKSVADQLHAAVSRLGLVSYGEKGDPFDPKIHEALMHSYSSEVTEDTCVEILQPGYKVGERILRPARVAVAEPELPEAETGEPGTADEEGN